MRLSPTFLAYFGLQFLAGIGLALLVLSALVFVIDLVELLRRASGRESAGIDVVFAMAALRLPFLVQKVMPFATLFGAMYALLKLTRTQELVVARAAGVSVWQFLMPGLLIAAVAGIFTVGAFNPIASVMMARYEQLEARYLEGRPSLLAVSSSGLWLRQADERGQSVLHADAVSAEGTELDRVTVYLYEGADRFLRRLDATAARLDAGFWELKDVLVTNLDGSVNRSARLVLPTSMTPTQIQESFASPETMSFWALPAFIGMLEDAGFTARRHRLHWHSLLATPLLLCAMLLIAATFTLRLTRSGGVGTLASGGVLAGFVLFFLSDLVLALGLSSAIPVALAAWTPAGVCSLLGIAMLMHLEDG